MKKIVVLLLFVLLIVTTTIMPINTKAFYDDGENIFNQTNANTVSKLTKSIFLRQLQTKDEIYSFEIYSDQPLTDADMKDLSFKAIGTNANGLNKTLSLADFEHSIEKAEKSRIYHIIELKNPDIYQNTKTDLSFEVNYGSENLSTATVIKPKFIFATGLKSNGMTAEQVKGILRPVYYSSDDDTLSIPVCTRLLKANNYYRSVFTTMGHTPNYLGLKRYERFPYVDSVKQENGEVKIKVSSFDLKGFGEPAKGKMLLNNLIKTFAVGRGQFYVDSVSFAIDEGNTSKALGGVDIARTYPVYHGAKLYLPYVVNEETTWVPIGLQDNPDFDVLAKGVINIYKDPKNFANGVMTQLVATDVELESATILGKTAQLHFNQELIDNYTGNPDATRALIEGLALTFSSLSYIDNYEIYVNGQLVPQIGEIGISYPIYRPVYYNVDKDYIRPIKQ